METYPRDYHVVLQLTPQQAECLIVGSTKMYNKQYKRIECPYNTAGKDVAVYQHDGTFLLIEITPE